MAFAAAPQRSTHPLPSSVLGVFFNDFLLDRSTTHHNILQTIGYIQIVQIKTFLISYIGIISVCYSLWQNTVLM